MQRSGLQKHHVDIHLDRYIHRDLPVILRFCTVSFD